jgi:hypothetical protein
MQAGFVLHRCRIFAQAIPVGGVDMEDHLDLLRREQKLFPHFGETGTAILLIQEIEYGGHDPLPSLDRYQQCCPPDLFRRFSSSSENGFFSEEYGFFARGVKKPIHTPVRKSLALSVDRRRPGRSVDHLAKPPAFDLGRWRP